MSERRSPYSASPEGLALAVIAKDESLKQALVAAGEFDYFQNLVVATLEQLIARASDVINNDGSQEFKAPIALRYLHAVQDHFIKGVSLAIIGKNQNKSISTGAHLVGHGIDLISQGLWGGQRRSPFDEELEPLSTFVVEHAPLSVAAGRITYYRRRYAKAEADERVTQQTQDTYRGTSLDLNLVRALVRNNVTLGQLREMSDEQILHLTGIGPIKRDMIQAAIRDVHPNIYNPQE